MDKIIIEFSQAYGGGIKANAFIGTEKYILELDHLAEYLTSAMIEKGYTKKKEKYEKYYRITINK